MDPYMELGVSRDATAREIREAYRLAVKRYHPDRHQGNPLLELAQEKMQRINRAYAQLSGTIPEPEAAALHERAMACMRQGLWDQARKELEAGLRRFPGDALLEQDLHRVEALLRSGAKPKYRRK